MSYVPLFWDRSERQEQLRAEYGFKCRCERCRFEKEQEKQERAAQGEEEHDHEHDHDHGDGDDDEDDDDDGDDDDLDGEDDEDDADEPLSEDDAEDLNLNATQPIVWTRGELNIYSMKYVCPSVTCGGTMAPLKKDPVGGESAAPAQGKAAGETMECNVCSKPRTDAQFHRQLAKEFGVRK